MRLIHAIHQRVERMWWRPDTPPLLLRWASHVYGAINRRQLQQRARNMQIPPIPMLSVGNITVGGSGKTPFVVWLAQELKRYGYAPVILCRGDGGSTRQPHVLDQHSRPEIAGDEACLLFEASGCPVISARDRIAGSQLATELGNVLILDDGFQYRHLDRICDIVLVPAEGVGNGQLIPAGPLREAPSALERANIIIRTGAPPNKQLSFAHAREWEWQTIADGLTDIRNTGTAQPDRLLAAAGIARPQRFFDSLRAQGYSVVETCRFPDHHRFSDRDVEALLQHQLAVVVTGKDAVKLQHLWPHDQPLWVLQQQHLAEDGLFEAIMGYLGPVNINLDQSAAGA